MERSDPEKQETLVSENVPDPMNAEQTWPTEDEIKMAQSEEKNKKTKKVPKGWSEYQAAWIPDDEEELLSDLSDDDKDPNMDAMSEEKSECSDRDEDFDTVTISEMAVDDQEYDAQIDLNVEQSELEKLKAAKVDFMFPDEVDTPQNVTARVRFQKYRGLESFRYKTLNNSYLIGDNFYLLTELLLGIL